MKSLFQFSLAVLFFGTTLFPASAAFTSLHVFGDALSSTTDNTPASSSYYGNRFSNGRVWVEVLAQRQGLAYAAGNNNSYYDHNSTLLAAEINSFSAPPDATNALFVVWVCNADTFDSASDFTTGSTNDIYAQWQAANNLAQANHLQIITNLYGKGVRTLILPNAVDISQIPAFNAGSTLVGVQRAGCMDYNAKFSNTLNQARSLCPGLKIYSPDYFTLLNNVLTNAAYYGLTNALKSGGFTLDALNAVNFGFPPAVTNGFGTNFIFWDNQNPTAKFHAVIAAVAQQLISPVQVGKITAFVGSNRLDVVNMPVGLDGFVDGVTNLALANWSSVQGFSSTNATQAVFVPPAGPQQFYRLRFPYAWSWP